MTRLLWLMSLQVARRELHAWSLPAKLDALILFKDLPDFCASSIRAKYPVGKSSGRALVVGASEFLYINLMDGINWEYTLNGTIVVMAYMTRYLASYILSQLYLDRNGYTFIITTGYDLASRGRWLENLADGEPQSRTGRCCPSRYLQDLRNVSPFCYMKTRTAI